MVVTLEIRVCEKVRQDESRTIRQSEGKYHSLILVSGVPCGSNF